MNLFKNKIFAKGVAYDLVGMATVGIPFIGPFLDLLWAPYAAKKMQEMYPGRKGKLASVIVFIEEILPFTDIIPTFTLMYLYTHVWKKEPLKVQVIEVESY